MHISRNLFFAIILTLPLFSFAQKSGVLHGIVVDAENEKPLPYAHILIEASGLGNTTDKSGSFSISGINPGEYTIRISFVGYHEELRTVKILAGENPGIRISLSKKPVTIHEVLIKGKKDAIVPEEPLRMAYLPAARIEANPSEQITGIMDYVSGVNVYSPLGIYSSKTVVSMRGLSGNNQSRVLVMLDGMPLNKADGGSVNWNQINKDRIEDIRISKGPGQAKYGGGAMGGVIEMTSKKPTEKLQGFVRAEYGTYNTFGGDANLSGNNSVKGILRDVYWSLDGSAKLSDGYITEAEEFIEEEDSILVPSFLKEYNISGKLGLNFRKGHNLEIQSSYYDDKRGNGVEVFEEYGAWSEHDSYYNLLKYNKSGDILDYHFSFYFMNEYYDRLYEYMNEGEYKLYDVDAKRRDMGMKGNILLKNIKNQALEAGFQLKNGMVDATDTYYTSTDIIHNAGKMNTLAFYIQDDIRLYKDKLHLYAGLRYNIATYYDGLYTILYPSYSIKFMTAFQDTAMADRQWTSLCPSASLQYSFSDYQRIYISSGRGFRAPILDDMTRTSKKNGSFSISNPSLKPEFLDNFEIGGDIIFFGDLSLSLSAYYSIGHDFMYNVSTGDSVNMGYKIAPVFQKRNISKVVIKGIELDIDYNIFPFLTFLANYSFSHSQIKDYQMNDPDVDVDLNGKHLTDVPDHKITAGISLRKNGFMVNITAKYIGERWINDHNIVDDEYMQTDKYPAYTILSAKVEKSFFYSLRISLSINNIFNKIYIENQTQRCPGRFVIVGVGYYF